MLDIEQIKEIIPHRYPFLLLDRVLEMKEGEGIVAIKNVSANEQFFQGHFPDYPVMPGVLIIEAMAQAGVVCLLNMPGYQGKIPFFTGIDNAKFRRQVVPGDQLRLEVEITALRGRFGRGKGRALVGDELAAEAEIKFAIQE